MGRLPDLPADAKLPPGLTREGKLEWVKNVLSRFQYDALSRDDKGTLKQYLEKTTGYSRAQMTRLIATSRAAIRETAPVMSQALQPTMIRRPFAFAWTASAAALMLLVLVRGFGSSTTGSLTVLSGDLERRITGLEQELHRPRARRIVTQRVNADGSVALDPLLYGYDHVTTIDGELIEQQFVALTARELEDKVAQRRGVRQIQNVFGTPNFPTAGSTLLSSSVARRAARQNRPGSPAPLQTQPTNVYPNYNISNETVIPDRAHGSAPAEVVARGNAVIDAFGGGSDGQILMIERGLPVWRDMPFREQIRELSPHGEERSSRGGGGGHRGGGGGGGGGSTTSTTTNTTTTITQTIDSAEWTDGGTDVYLTTATDNVIIGGTVADTKLEVVGMISGSVIYAADSLRSSGSLVWEGAASGASLWVSSFQGANLVDCDNSTNSKLLWDSTTGRFSCGADQGGASAFTAGQGLSLNVSNAFSLSSSFSGTALEIIGTASGRIIHAQDILRSSGSLIVEGATVLQSTIRINGVTYTFPSADGTATGKVLKTNAAGQLSWSSDIDTDTNTTYGAGQGLSLSAGNMFSLTSVFSGTSLEIIGTSSGRILHAQDSLTSSGTLVWEGAGSGASLWVSTATIGNSLQGAGLTDCDVATQTLAWDATTGKFSCGTDSDTTYTAGQSITLNASNAFSLSTSFSGTALEIQGTMSGRVLHAQDQLRSSGTLIVEGVATFGSQVLFIESGNYTNPSLSFTNDTDTGISRTGINTFNFITNAANRMELNAANITLNDPANDYDFLIKGDNDTALFFTDASADKVGIGTITPTEKLEIIGTASGTHLHAQAGLSSSGSLVWEGSASGATLWVSRFNGAGLTSCNADNQTLAWNSTSQQFECGDDDTGAGASIAPAQGLTSPASGFLALSTSFSGTALEIQGTMSGRFLHTQDGITSSGSIRSNTSLRSSGTLAIDGLAYLNDDLQVGGGNINFTQNTTIGDGGDQITIDSNGTLVINDATIDLSAQATAFSLNNAANALAFDTSTLSIDALNNRIGIGMTAPKYELDVTGSIHASAGLSSSGTLVWEGAASGASLYISSVTIGGSFQGVGLTDCDAAASSLQWDAIMGRFSCDTTGGNTYSAAQGLSLNASNAFSLNTSFSGTSLEIMGTASGRILHASDRIQSSGSLIVETTGRFKGNLTTRGTLSGAALTVMNGTSYVMGNLGIGDTTPNSLLTVGNGDLFEVGSDGRVTINLNDSLLNAGVTIMQPGLGDGVMRAKVGDTTWWTWGIDNSDSDKFKISPTASIGDGMDLLTIQTNGNIGVDLVSPGSRLSVSGAIIVGTAIDTASADAGLSLEIIGTSSGRILHAQDSLTSSGTLVWEGAGSGASLWVSRLSGAGLTSCNADNQTIAWNSTTQQFECGDDDTGGAGSTAAAQGLTSPASGFLALSTSFSGTALEIQGTMSGRFLHAQDGITSSGSIRSNVSLRSSGTLAIDGIAYLNDDLQLLGGDITGANGAILDLGEATSGDITVTGDFIIADNSFFGLSSSTGRFEFDDQATDEFNILNANVGIGTQTPTEALEVIGTVSGSTLYAAQSLRSSGSLVWEGSASGASLWVSQFNGAGLVTTCDPTTGKLTWNSTAKQFVCGTDLNTGSTYTAAQGLTLNASNAFSLSTSFSGTALEILGTSSGRILHAQDRLQSSGSLSIEGKSYMQDQIFIPDGSDTTPALAFSADQDTGIYRSTNNQFRIVAGGTAALVVEANATYVNNGTVSAPSLASNGATNYGFYWPSSSSIAVTANGQEAMRIISGGNVGLDTPTPGSRLSISGSVIIGNNIESAQAQTGFLLEIIGAASGRILHAQDALRSSGSLVVKGVTYLNDQVRLGMPSGAGAIGTAGAPTLQFGTTWVDGIYRPSGQQIGIATNGKNTTLFTNDGIALTSNRDASTPGALFHLQSEGTTSTLNEAWFHNIFSSATGFSQQFRKARGSFASPSVITAGDDLGMLSGYGYVGGTNTYVEGARILFDSEGTISDATTGLGGAIVLQTRAVGRSLREVFRLTSTGSMGIGTATPVSKLTVSGAMIVGGNIGFASADAGLSLEILGTASGRIFHAQDTLSSSGTLVWEGAGSGASLYVASFFGASLVDCDADNQTLHWDATLKQFSCGDDDTGAGASTAPAQGLTSPASGFLALSTSFSGTALEILGTSSGRILYAADKILGSGTLLVDGTISTKGNLTINSDNGAADAILTFGSDGSAETLTFANAGDRFEFSDDLYVLNTFEVDGNAQFDGATVTLGDASGDAVTVNSATWTFANDTNFALTGGTNGLAFDTNTFSIDALNNRIGILTTAPDSELEIIGTASGKTLFANDTLSSSGNLIVESLVKRGSGAISVLAATYQTGAYLFSSGASALALESYTQNLYGGQHLAPNILFGYQGVFDTALYRTSGSTLRTDDQFLITTDDAFNRSALKIDTAESTTGQAIFEVFSDVSSTQNLVFKFTAGGDATADGAFTGGGADYAEYFYTSTPDLEFGEVVCIDVLKNNTVKRCTSEADPNVMGIVSSTDQAAFIGNKFSGAEGIAVPGTVLVGLIGQLSTKAVVAESDSASGELLVIRPGDSLTPSTIPGVVRKAKAGEPTVGVALSGLDTGEGRIDVLIARSNSSLAADTISDRVLQTINDLQIADEVQLMVDGAMQDLDLEAAVGEEFRTQFATFDLKTSVESLVASILQQQESSNQHEGVQTHEPEEQALFRNIGISGSALIQADLEVRGTMNVLNIDSAGDIITQGILHAAAVQSDSGATLRGRVEIEGDLVINGLPYDPAAFGHGSGSNFLTMGPDVTADLGTLTVHQALYVLGDATIEGFAQFLGNVDIKGSLTISGSLVVSRNQAGYALIPMGGTGVMVVFDPPMAENPIVTVSSDSFEPHRVRAVTATGFTIEVQTPVLESIIISWHALLAKDPFTAEGMAASIIRKIPFPVDGLGYPLSSNIVWNSCIRNQVQLDAEGQPFSCSRYHVDNIWTHPDLLIEFTWLSDQKMLMLPDGFEAVVQETEVSIEEASSSSSSLEQEPESSESASSEEESSSSASSDASSSADQSSAASEEASSSSEQYSEASSEQSSSEESSSADDSSETSSSSSAESETSSVDSSASE